MKIDGRTVLDYDYIWGAGEVKLEGTEKLNRVSMGEKLSFVKYVFRNSVLADNAENRVFQQFIDFVDHMLLFYSLSERYYQGFKVGRESIGKGIIERGKVKDFENFLRSNGIDLKLSVREIDDEKQLMIQFQSGETRFLQAASTGTKTLELFYYWYIQMEEASFVFMDEFDAFYHYELSEQVIRKIKELTHVQFVMTTHNTDLLTNDLMRPDCLFELEDNKIRSLADSTPKELRKAHNLQKMYKAGAFHD